MTENFEADRPIVSENLAMVSELLSPEGWVYASSPPVEARDPASRRSRWLP